HAPLPPSTAAFRTTGRPRRGEWHSPGSMADQFSRANAIRPYGAIKSGMGYCRKDFFGYEPASMHGIRRALSGRGREMRIGRLPLGIFIMILVVIGVLAGLLYIDLSRDAATASVISKRE